VRGCARLLSAANIHYFSFSAHSRHDDGGAAPSGAESAGGTLFALAGFRADAAIVMGFLATLVEAPRASRAESCCHG